MLSLRVNRKKLANSSKDKEKKLNKKKETFCGHERSSRKVNVILGDKCNRRENLKTKLKLKAENIKKSNDNFKKRKARK